MRCIQIIDHDGAAVCIVDFDADGASACPDVFRVVLAVVSHAHNHGGIAQNLEPSAVICCYVPDVVSLILYYIRPQSLRSGVGCLRQKHDKAECEKNDRHGHEREFEGGFH